ncbi:MAG TPA: 4-hydroxybenzoate octaprenyltransferase [Candidatus Saccharimonadia bacterium]|nr:4-hydroxybenzoate octaprenyltransferase [Candidatus Saccharimonadia bacterium]
MQQKLPPTRQAVRRATIAARTGQAVVRPPRLLEWMSPRIYERLREYALLTRQDRPIGWLLLLWPTWWALWLASGGMPSLGTLVVFTLGVVVMRSAGCVINDYADRGLDPHVARTATRPLARGSVTPREAVLVFVVLLAIALGLVLLTNRKTMMLAGAAALLAIAYPYMKRHTWWPQVWLGAAFGMSIPMAYTAVTDAWPPPLAWLLFTANLLWVTAYDTWYAMVDRDDDLRAGARSTAILFGDLDLVAVGTLLASFVGAMAFVGARAGFGMPYRVSLLVAAAMCAWQLWYARDRSAERCFAAFRSNHYVGLVLFAGIALDYALAPA